MKPEPLKDKLGIIDSGEFNSKFIKQGATTLKVAVNSDIKSAVEWLKAKVNTECKDTGIVHNNWVQEWIDKAFEDVTK